MNKTLLITHVDLDGISPVILMNLTGEKFDYKSIEIHDVDSTFDDLVETKEINNYKKIFVTDLTLTEHAYEILNNLNDVELHVFDHHETHLFANKFPYVQVAVNINGRQTCGTELIYLYLKEIYKEVNRPIVDEYVNYVRELDTWNFTSDIPKELDSLKNTYGSKEFIKSITRRLKKDKQHFEFTQFEKKFTKLKKQELQRYLEKKDSKMFKYEIQGKKCGVIFAETNKSELGNYSSINHPDLDLIILIDASSRISYRTNKDDVSVSEFASAYGGGGHQKASGSSFKDDNRTHIIETYFEGAKRLETIEEEI